MSNDIGATRRPTTKAGTWLWRLLQSPEKKATLRWALAARSRTELAYQAWVVAMRRLFAQEVDIKVVKNWMSAALSRRGEAFVRSGVVASLVDMALYGKSPKAIHLHERALILPLLHEAILTSFTSAEDLADLVRAAEQRVVRLHRKQARARRTRPWGGGGGTGRDSSLVADADAGPTSVMGHRLKAHASFDQERLEALPREESVPAIDAMADAAFKIAAEERFRRGRSEDMIASFAQRTAAISTYLLFDESIARSLIDGVFKGGSDVDEHLDPDLVLHGKIRLFAQAVEDLGLFEHEVDEIIRRAEQVIAAQGIRLIPMRRSTDSLR